LWRIDRARATVALIAYGYTFLDGVLLEPGPDGDVRSVLITETPKFRILRLHLSGARAGADEILWDSLPGMPDGLDRDPEGRIWVGLYGKRTAAVTWVHGHPWIKPLLLRLPPAQMPVPQDTGILVLDPDARTPRYYVMHDGSRVREISAVVPGADRLYLPSFALDNRGLVTMPYPAPLTRRR
jgi:sugar lactone lactonase YvrE